MKLYGILTVNKELDIKDIDGALKLDDIHFNVLSKDNELISIHLDFDDIDGRFARNRYFVRFQDLADTWTDLNLESGIKKEDITIELLKSGFVENYIMFFTKKNGEKITDITMREMGYMDEEFNFIPFEIKEHATNEA